MNIEVPLKLKMSLGISSKETPSIRTLMKRMHSQIGVAAAGKANLNFMHNDDLILDAKLNSSGEYWKFEAELKQDSQLPLLESNQKRLAQRAAARGRGDQLALDFADEIHNELLHSSDLVSKAATLMDSSDNLKSDIQGLEQAEGASTTAARRYLFDRGPAFSVEIDGTEVEFSSRAVRTYSVNKIPVWVRLAVLSAFDETNLVLVELIWAECPLEVKRPYKPFTLQTLDLSPRERALIDCGRHLGIPLEMKILQEVSTCTLEATRIRAIAVAANEEILKILGERGAMEIDRT